MERWVGKTALVTGAASGIGEAITTTLLKEKVNVVGLDLQVEKLSRIADKVDKHSPVKFYAQPCDVTKEKDVADAFALAQNFLDGVDIMVNNVGIVDYTPVIGHEMPTWNISDDVGHNGWNLYPTSKHATVALTHTVRRELAVAKASIRITSISPGLVRTNISRAWPDVQAKLNEMIMLDPQDIADGVIYALSRRPEVQITELTIRSRGEM